MSSSFSFDQYMLSKDSDLNEMTAFHRWKSDFDAQDLKLNLPHRPLSSGLSDYAGHEVVNLSSYDYLGFGAHPEVIEAACQARKVYGLGAHGSPVLNGYLDIHRSLENNLLDFFQIKDLAVSLFSSGYNVCQGVIQAFCHPGSVVLLDERAHVSLEDGAKLSGASVMYFKHNNTQDLEDCLKSLNTQNTRVLIGVEGVYGADGDDAPLDEIVSLAKKYNAYTLVDEAHSVLVAGENGRGASEKYKVLNEIDLYVMTFSKGFGGSGGAVIAKKEIISYLNWYAKTRAFSCAIDPGVCGGLVKVLELASGTLGSERRDALHHNASYFRTALQQKLPLIDHDSWIIPIVFGEDEKGLDLVTKCHDAGLDMSLHIYPAVPKNNGRLRCFMSSQHTKDQLDFSINTLLNVFNNN